MARIRVRPACGSGNFLVIAYKQMREIEAEINRRRGEPTHLPFEIPLTNFRGIELRDFPGGDRAAGADHCRVPVRRTVPGAEGRGGGVLPLDAENWIICGNALRLDWLSASARPQARA